VWQVQVAGSSCSVAAGCSAQDSELWSEQVAGGPKLSLGETVAMVAAATGFKLLQHIWNPDEVYSRYIPCIYHVYSERRYIPGISQVYTMDIEMLFSWIYGQVNAVIQSND
jgi:hypothetical protein